MAGGELGIDKAIDILTDQFRRTLHLLGMPSAAELRAHGRELLVAP
jgi:isopentenyl diphosphate isomerase/L-lactate dehydrogenase-like FMN-dependent dehydrogenase